MMSDPIADMLTRIRNAQAVGKKQVKFPNNKLKCAILDVLKTEGYIDGYQISEDQREIAMNIRYHHNKPVMATLKRFSHPGLRRYANAKSIPLVKNGLGISVVSTSKGVMSDHQARQLGVGGELLCEIS